MMAESKNVVELVALSQANGKTAQGTIAEILQNAGGSDLVGADAEALRAATVEIELAAIDIYSVFEARMQHHFRRGPFSRKLKALLVESGKVDLAGKIHQYYLAINVLKHGKGESYRELLREPTPLVVVRPAEDTSSEEAPVTDAARPVGLVDVTDPSFFAGLTAAIIEAAKFLEKR